MSKKLLRGINFVEEFKNSCLYKELYLPHQDELFLCIRVDYINIYYNTINIAYVSMNRDHAITCKINEYYFTGISNSPDITFSSENEIREKLIANYDTIKKNSDKKSNSEKKSQAALFIKNNLNSNSEWYCTDVEWAKQFLNQTEKDMANFNARFDIVAITKSLPHKIAIIELKYGKKSVSNESGIKKHIEDFYKFNKKGYYNSFLMETISILKNRRYLDPTYPVELKNIRSEEFATQPEFYFITLDNNPESVNSSTPKQTVGGYLFNDKTRWNSPKVSKETIESIYGDVTNPDNDKVTVKFLFSKLTIDDLYKRSSLDIINDEMYSK